MRPAKDDIHEQLPAFAVKLRSCGLHIVPNASLKPDVGRVLARKEFMAYPGISESSIRGDMYDYIQSLGGMVIEGQVLPERTGLFR